MSRPSAPKSNDILMAQEVVRFDPVAFDMLLRSHGVRVEHWRAVKCPLGVDDKHDIRNHSDHNCSNGFKYIYAGDVTVFFSNNTSSSSLEYVGYVDGSMCNITLPRYYDTEGDTDGEEILVQHYDRFYLKEVVTASVNTQLIEAHVAGRDRLQYLPIKVEYVEDANGVVYAPGDYRIEGGEIVWNGSRRPQFRADIGKGTVYSIRYRYTPFWYVRNILHEVRVCRIYDHAAQAEVVIRLPHAVQLQREFMFEQEERQRNGTADARDVKSPRSGSFGPR